jgi:hypothetical protein
MPIVLRLLQVFRAEPAGSDTWIAAGPAVYLPRGVYVMPIHPAGLIAPGVNWPVNPPLTSTLLDVDSPRAAVGTDFADASHALSLEFGADGSVTRVENEPSVRVVIATANVSAGLPEFNNPAAVRGILIRANGAIGFVHDAAGF